MIIDRAPASARAVFALYLPTLRRMASSSEHTEFIANMRPVLANSLQIPAALKQALEEAGILVFHDGQYIFHAKTARAGVE
jgi:hypothetical protein